MTRDRREPPVSIVLPVYNGEDTVAGVIESVLAQTHADLELVISDNASTDGTEEVCRAFARDDGRVAYHRHPANVGLLNNFIAGARRARGTYVRWIGDEDELAAHYLASTLDQFTADRRRVLVSTQIVYTDPRGITRLDASYDPQPLSSTDPVVRFGGMLRLLTGEYSTLDPLYSMIRRDLAVLPRRNMLREDEIFAARLALAGPWGHVAAPLAHRHRSEMPRPDLTRLLQVPRWQAHAMDVLQYRQLLRVVDHACLSSEQRSRARKHVLAMYARRKRHQVRRGWTKLERLSAGGDRVSPSEAL